MKLFLFIFLIGVQQVLASFTCESTGVSCSWTKCFPLDVMVTHNRFHIKCQLPEQNNIIRYYALPVEYEFAVTTSTRPYYTESAHKALWSSIPSLSQNALSDKKVLKISWGLNSSLNPTERWGCLPSDCSILRGVVLTTERFGNSVCFPAP